jgi:alpha-tubulin suppressor-like RCC1 family protein
MKTRHLLYFPLGRLYFVALFIIAFFLHSTAIAQSETHDFITYDTTFRYNTAPTTPTFTLRISRPANMFTAGHPDTASRPVIISMPGSGEVGTNPAFLGLFGPHYWLNNGWDGSVQLGNGTHYPILITIITSSLNVRPQFILQLMDHLLNTYHIKRNSVHVAGLSMGGFTWGRFITYAATTGDETAMSMVTSYTAFQGIAYDNFNGVSWGLPGFGHWAKKYNGKFFGLEGTNDNRSVWSVRDAMDDSLAGNAYFSYESYGGGSHCCWNSMYNPSTTDWQCVAPITNPNVAINTNHPNSMGTYNKPSNVFQWMLRQGDSSLVNGTPSNAPTVYAGANQTLQLPLVSISLSGTATAAAGNTISNVSWSQTSGPTATILSVGNLVTTVIGISAGTYVFSLTATDNMGVSASSSVTIVVNPLLPPPPPPPSPSSNQKQVGQGEYQAYFIDANKHLWGLGNVSNIGTNNIGVQGVPQRVLVTPFDLKFKHTAGGLHGGAAIDTAGNVWTIGDNDQAQMGIGNTTHPIYTPQKILTDANGNPFTNVKSMTAFFLRVGGNGFNGWYAIKDDNTLWVWGMPLGGMRANGTDGTSDSIVERPTQIIMPGNRLVKQIVAGGFAIALCTDGTVWTWGLTSNSNLGYAASGSDYMTPHQLTQLSNIEQIAGGIAFNYALRNDGTLFGWGPYGAYMGEYVAVGGGAPKPTPVVLTNIMNNLPAPITKIVTNTVCTHVILADSTLWGWGDNAQGNIGNGQSLNWSSMATPWAWNYASGQLLVQLPYNVAPTRKFVDVFGSSVYTFYTYALGSDGQLFCWGRNKGSVLANKIRAATSSLVATYSNAWDINWPKPVDPFTITTSYISTSPFCITTPAGVPCNSYTIPGNTPPTANAGATQNITTTSAVLNGTASTDNVYIPYYEWKQVSGPNTAVMDVPGSATPRVSGLITGTYIFRLKVTDNGWLADSSTVQVVVNGGPPPPNQAPNANAGPDRNITLPLNNTTLAGSGTDADGTVAGFLWTRISGTGTFNIVSPTNALTVVNNLQQGTYEFELRVTDNLGAIDRDTVVVVVNAAVNLPPVANAGPNHNITLPINTITATGSGTDTDGTIAAYQWSWISGPTQFSIVSPTQAQTVINNLDQGTYRFELRVTDNLGAIGRDTMTVVVNAAVPPPNQLPTAIAGPNQIITLPINTVTLNGSGTDADGTITAYQWSWISGPTQFSIVSPTQGQTVINNLDQGIYRFELRVTDNQGAFGRDTVTITVNATLPPGNQAPIAYAGSNWNITLPVNSVTLTGSGTDADGTITAYQWRHVGGPSTLMIVTPGQSQTIVNSMGQGVYQFELRVTDNQGAFGWDTVTVTVNAAPGVNQPPVANAGPDLNITLPTNTVTLAGSGTDADGSVVAYQWTKIGGSVAFNIVSPAQAQTVVDGLAAGMYRFELRVTDNLGAYGLDTVTVTVNAVPVVNQPPVANAGPDEVLTLPFNTVNLPGSGTDADGTVTGYQWRHISGPSQYLIVSPTQAQTDITDLVAGIYEFELRVTDNRGATDRDTVKITVNVDQRLASSFTIFPNPATNIINVKIDAITIAAKTHVRVYDARGVVFYQEEFMRTQQVMTKQIDVSSFPPGVYFLKLDVDINNTKAMTFIKQ